VAQEIENALEVSVPFKSFANETWHKTTYLDGIQVGTRLSSRLGQSLGLVEVLDAAKLLSV